MSLADYIPAKGASEYSLAVVNRESPQPVQSILQDLFAQQTVSVEERSIPDDDRDIVLLLEDGCVVASSPLDALRDSILLVNSDIYITGSRDIADLDLPRVVEHLDEVPFSVRGYPHSDKEKLLLITISRYVERLAWRAGSGTLRAGFQRLSRINNEKGTRAVYEQLVAAGVDTHVYGIPDWDPPESFGVTAHGSDSPEFRNAWFVVYQSDGNTNDDAALVAYKRDSPWWDGFWTYQQDRVNEIDSYIERTM